MRLIDADDFANRMYHEAFEKDTDMQRLDSGCWIRYKLFENVLREQPTVQPDHTADISKKAEGDCVSRQAAIDAVDVLCQEHRYRIPGKRETYSQYNEAWQDALDRAEVAIGNLPTVQPDHTADISKKAEGDCVSRQMAIDAMKDALDPHIVQFVKAKMAKMAIEVLPSAQPEPKWTSCRKKLPEKEGFYLVQALMNGDIFVARWEGCYWGIKTPIVAWMTLPEPYKGGDAE